MSILWQDQGEGAPWEADAERLSEDRVVSPGNVVWVTHLGGHTGLVEPDWDTFDGTDGTVLWEFVIPWTPGTNYLVDAQVQPAAAPNSHTYVNVGGTGDSGTTEPTWPLVFAATVADPDETPLTSLFCLRMYFDVWDAIDLRGDSIGTVEMLNGKTIAGEWNNGCGMGQAVVNRHSSDAALLATNNLVRVRYDSDGPFEYDDQRYFHAFFVDGGQNVPLSPEEQGGETQTLGGRGALAYMERAVLYWYQRHEPPTVSSRPYLEEGVWKWHQNSLGQILFRLISEDGNKGPEEPLALPDLTQDFDPDFDTDGNAWFDWSPTDAWFQLAFLLNYLECIEKLRGEGLTVYMSPALMISCWQDYESTDVGIVFEKGVNLAESADQKVYGAQVGSRAVVKGVPDGNGQASYVEVVDDPFETAVGRREFGYEYQHTPDPGGLIKAGRTEIDRRKVRREGPTKIGVMIREGEIPFIDYRPGDSVTVNIPGVFESELVQIAAITLTEDTNGCVLAAVTFRDAEVSPTTAFSATVTGGGCQCPCSLGTLVPGTDDPEVYTAPAYYAQMLGPVHIGTRDGSPASYNFGPELVAGGVTALDYVPGTLAVFNDDAFVWVPVSDQSTPSFVLPGGSGEVYAMARVSCFVDHTGDT